MSSRTSSSTSSESITSNPLGRSGGNSNEDAAAAVAFHFSADEIQHARALLKEDGFDPDDLKKVSLKKWSRTALVYYCCTGNLPMIRYLIAHGADCRQQDEHGGFPLYYAAACGRLEILQLLSQDGGAHADIRRVATDGSSPLRMALRYRQFEVAKWLILNGALAPRGAVDGGDIDDATMRWDLCHEHWDNDKRIPILAWAQDVVATHDNAVQLSITGMIVSSNQTPSLWVKLNGKSCILKIIAKYAVAGISQQQLRTLRQLIRLLTTFIVDVPFPRNDVRIFRQLMDRCRLPVFIADVPFVIEKDEGEEG